MTNTAINPEQMLVIVRRVYRDKTWWIHDIREDGDTNVYGMVNGIVTRFRPSLTGTDREKAQACDVIAHADKLPEIVKYSSQESVFKLLHSGDILTRSMLRVLESK